MFFISKADLQEIIDGAVKKAVTTSLSIGEDDKLKLMSLTDQIVELKKQKTAQTEELEEVKLKKKQELRDIEHLVKCKTEKNEIEAERKAVSLEKTFQQKEMALQTEYHDKSLALIEKGATNLQDIYAKIIDRLPNVTMDIHKNS